ncbi:hypothetical protein NL676_038099 [Syzygium grande]|nr:hypothetical protein NL676_038099 [Syzygium grande]
MDHGSRSDDGRIWPRETTKGRVALSTDTSSYLGHTDGHHFLFIHPEITFCFVHLQIGASTDAGLRDGNCEPPLRFGWLGHGRQQLRVAAMTKGGLTMDAQWSAWTQCRRLRW